MPITPSSHISIPSHHSSLSHHYHPYFNYYPHPSHHFTSPFSTYHQATIPLDSQIASEIKFHPLFQNLPLSFKNQFVDDPIIQ